MKRLNFFLKLVLPLFALSSCGRVLKNTWTITDFNKTHSFAISTEEGQDVTGARTYIDGDFTGTIYLSTVENDSTLKYTQKSLPEDGILSDFYGGTFEMFLAKSDAQGEITVTIEIPYH